VLGARDYESAREYLDKYLSVAKESEKDIPALIRMIDEREAQSAPMFVIEE
jgi:hypothetical protein